MKLPHLFQRGWLLVWMAIYCAWQLSGCGGSVVAGGVGSGGSGVAEGTVSGFGSVIVEGVAYGDSSATVERWGESGVAEAKLGQRVRVTYDSSGQAMRIVVLPQLIGQANSAPNAQGDFVMLGQRVRIVDDSSVDHPATLFDGLTQVSQGDALEVHGNWSRDSEGRTLLIASRIERLASNPNPVLLTALVLARQGNNLTLDDLAQTRVTADSLPDTVQAGALVSLWLTRNAVQIPSSPLHPWVAIRGELASVSADNNTLQLNGVVSDSDSQQERIRVQGLWVKLPADWNEAVPTNGTPVQLKLQRNNSNSDWQASSLSAQRVDAVPFVEIKGSLRWSANASSLQLRSTTVQLPTNLLAGSCAGLQDGEEVYVNLKAKRRNPGLLPQAAEIECSRQIPQASVQEARGTLLSVNADQKTLDVRVGSDTLTLIWANDQTLMPDLEQLRMGMGGEIEYQRGSNGLMLRKLKPE